MHSQSECETFRIEKAFCFLPIPIKKVELKRPDSASTSSTVAWLSYKTTQKIPSDGSWYVYKLVLVTEYEMG